LSAGTTIGKGAFLPAEISFATDQAQRQSVYRLRYEQYCEAQALLGERADHRSRTLCEDDDATAHLMTACQDGQLLGTMRLQWGGDGSFGVEMEQSFDIASLAGSLRHDQIAIGSRFILHPSVRGGGLMVRMMAACLEFCLDHGVELLLGDCEPHLVQMYRGLGFRTYKTLINHETSGVLVPLALACNDLDHMVRVGSPLRRTLRAARGESTATIPHCADLFPTTDAIVSADPNDRQGVGEALVSRFLSFEDQRPDLFQGLDPKQIERLLARSNVLCCETGDALIRRGHTSRTLYVVLDGTLEVRHGDKVVAVASRGDVFGEFAFLMDVRRTADVFAAEDGVRVLALSEAKLSTLISTDAELAAKLLLNLSRALCYKLVTNVPEDD